MPKCFKKYNVFYEEDVLIGSFNAPHEAFEAFHRAFGGMFEKIFEEEAGVQHRWDWHDLVMIIEVNEDGTHGSAYGVTYAGIKISEKNIPIFYCSVHPVDFIFEEGP